MINLSLRMIKTAPYAGSMFTHRLRRWPKIEPALGVSFQLDVNLSFLIFLIK